MKLQAGNRWVIMSCKNQLHDCGAPTMCKLTGLALQLTKPVLLVIRAVFWGFGVLCLHSLPGWPHSLMWFHVLLAFKPPAWPSCLISRCRHSPAHWASPLQCLIKYSWWNTCSHFPSKPAPHPRFLIPGTITTSRTEFSPPPSIHSLNTSGWFCLWNTAGISAVPSPYGQHCDLYHLQQQLQPSAFLLSSLFSSCHQGDLGLILSVSGLEPFSDLLSLIE